MAEAESSEDEAFGITDRLVSDVLDAVGRGDGASRPSSVPTGTEARSGGTKASVASLPKGVTSAVTW